MSKYKATVAVQDVPSLQHLKDGEHVIMKGYVFARCGSKIFKFPYVEPKEVKIPQYAI